MYKRCVEIFSVCSVLWLQLITDIQDGCREQNQPRKKEREKEGTEEKEQERGRVTGREAGRACLEMYATRLCIHPFAHANILAVSPPVTKPVTPPSSVHDFDLHKYAFVSFVLSFSHSLLPHLSINYARVVSIF